METKLTGKKVIYGKGAPRFIKTEFLTRLVSKTSYSEWLEQTDHKDITYNQWVAVWDGIVKQIKEHVIFSAEGVNLPFGCGELLMKYCMMYDMPVDIKSTIEYGRQILHDQPIVNGYPIVGKIVWATNRARKRNKYCLMYGFTACEDLKWGCVINGFEKHPERYRDARISQFLREMKRNPEREAKLAEKKRWNYKPSWQS